MANHDITFRVLGNLDPSLLAALHNAQRGIRNLSSAQKSFNAKALAQARQLSAAQGVLKNVEAYKNLQAAIKDNQRLKAQELLTQSRLNASRSQENQKLNDMRQAYDSLRDFYKANRRNMDAQAAAVMKSQLQSARLEIKAQESLVKGIDKQFAQASAAVAKLNRQLSEQQAKLAALGSKVNVGNLSAQEAALREQIHSTTNALNAEIAALERRNRIQSNFAQAQQNLANAYSNFQNAVDTAGTIMNPFKATVANAMDYEFAMSKVKALTQMRNIRSGNLQQVTKDMAALDAQAKQLGATTEFTSTEIANAMGFYGMAGWDTSRIQAIMQSTVDLASIAGDHNIARTADVLSDDLSALGMKAGRQMRLTSGKVVEESKYFADAFAYAITQANLNRESLHEALKYNAPTSHATGLSLGETLAMNMIAASSGIKGSMAGTAFRAGWTRFLAPPKTAAKALQEMGLEASDATKSIMEAQAALKEIGVAEDANLFTKITQAYQHYQTLDKNQKAGWLKNLVGQNALSAWQIVFDTGNIEQIAKIAQEIDSGAIEGWAADTAGVMRDNTSVQFELLKSSIDACANSVGNVFLPAVRSAMAGLAEGASSLNTWIQNNQTAVQWAGILAAALSAVIVAGAGIALVGAAFSYVSSGILVAVSAVRAVVVAFNAARVAVMSFGAVSAIAGAVATAPIWAIAAAVIGVVAIVGYATGAFDGLGDAIANAWNHPQGAITGFCELAKSAVDGAVDYVVNRWNTLRSALAHPIDAIINFMDHGDVIGGNVISGEQQAARIATAQAHSTASNGAFNGGGGSFEVQAAAQEVVTSIQTVPPPMNELSYSAQAAAMPMNELGFSAQMTSPAMNELALAAPMLPPEFNNTALAAQMTSPELLNVGTSAQTASPSVDYLGQSSQGSSNYVQALGGVALSASVNIAALSGAASAVAGALQAKAAEIAAIHITVPQVEVIHTTVNASAPASHNARGGIYPRGEFLTTFAERSPEAAIPIDNSARAKSLWFETGHLLGFNNILPGDRPRIPINRPRVNRFPINRPRSPINFPFPYQTPPTFPEINQPKLEPPIERGAGNVSITINVNISGNADRQEVQRGIESALPRVESFADQLAAYNHERRRVSYA